MSADFLLTNSEEIRFCCPQEECGDTKFHLYVNPVKGVFHCKKCDYKGHISKLSKDILEVLDIDVYKLERPVKSEVVVPTEYRRLTKPDTYLASQYWEYLLGRGLKEEDIRNYYLGYCYEGQYDRRLIIPVVQNNSIVAFEARDIYGKKPKTIFQGSKDYFFNYDNVFERNESEEVVIVEGIFDVFKVGKKNTLGCWGHTLTAGQQLVLRKKNPKKVTVFFDQDAKDSIYKTAEVLKEFIEKVEVALLSKGDPGDYENPLEVAEVKEYEGLESKMEYLDKKIFEKDFERYKGAWERLTKL